MRELAMMLRGHQYDEWARASMLMFGIVSPHTKKQLDANTFNPTIVKDETIFQKIDRVFQ